MILGFDNDDATIFDAQREFLTEARIVHAMIGMLSAIPKTPLYDRLAAEGRLDLADEAEFGTNVIPLRLDREELRDGFVRVLSELYEPEAYFDRLEELYLDARLNFSRGRTGTGGGIRGTVRAKGLILAQALVFLARLIWKVARSGPAPRVPPADLAALPGPARPERPLDLRRQVRHAVPRPPDGDADDRGGRGRQYLLIRDEGVLTRKRLAICCDHSSPRPTVSITPIWRSSEKALMAHLLAERAPEVPRESIVQRPCQESDESPGTAPCQTPANSGPTTDPKGRSAGREPVRPRPIRSRRPR